MVLGVRGASGQLQAAVLTMRALRRARRPAQKLPAPAFPPERYVPIFGASQYLEQEAAAVEATGALQGFDAVVLAMGELIAAGKIREWGVSNETSFGVCSLVEAC